MSTSIKVPEVKIMGIPGIPIVEEGDDLVALIHDAATAAQLTFEAGDILVVTQKKSCPRPRVV